MMRHSLQEQVSVGESRLTSIVYIQFAAWVERLPHVFQNVISAKTDVSNLVFTMR